MELVHILGAPILYLTDAGGAFLVLGIFVSSIFFLFPFIAPFFEKGSTKVKILNSLSWLIPWIALLLFWYFQGSSKGLGNAFFEGVAALVICFVLAVTLYLSKGSFRKVYYYGFSIASISLVLLSAITPYIGK